MIFAEGTVAKPRVSGGSVWGSLKARASAAIYTAWTIPCAKAQWQASPRGNRAF